jgi:hypothetical protein
MGNAKDLFVLGLVLLLSTSVSAYAIDGSLSDWGVNLISAFGGNESAWVPSSNTTQWAVENNIDPACVPFTGIYGHCVDWTGYSAKGTHIKGEGQVYGLYAEPALTHADGWDKYDGPAGGEVYDIEALYFDDQVGFANFAIVTSMPESGHTDQWGRHTDTGDIALDLDNNPATGQYGYEYGIQTSGPKKGQVCYMPSWSLPNAADGFPQDAPSTMYCNGTNSKILGYAQLKYASAGVSDNGYPNWVIETKIPKWMIGMPAKGSLGDIHVTITCGNDVVEIRPFKWNFDAPEFPGSVAAILILVFAPAAGWIATRK